MIASLNAATSATTRWLVLLLVLDQIDDLVRYSQVFDLAPKLAHTGYSTQTERILYIVSPHIDLRQSEEFVTLWARLNYLLKRKIHPGVTTDQVAVECLSILELDEHRVALSCIEKTQWQLSL